MKDTSRANALTTDSSNEETADDDAAHEDDEDIVVDVDCTSCVCSYVQLPFSLHRRTHSFGTQLKKNTNEQPLK